MATFFLPADLFNRIDQSKKRGSDDLKKCDRLINKFRSGELHTEKQKNMLLEKYS